MKKQITETALQKFLAYGIRKTPMQKLADELGISTKTMYKYFSSKNDLLEECLKIHYAGADDSIMAIVNASPNPVISIVRIYAKLGELDFGTNHLFYHDLNYYYPELQDKVINQYTRCAFETMAALIDRGIEEGYFLPYLKAPVVLQTLMVLYTTVTRNTAYKNFAMKRELVKHTIAIYLRGLCTDKGLQIINESEEL